MKKLLALTLAVLFVVSLLVGCNNDNAGGDAPSRPSSGDVQRTPPPQQQQPSTLTVLFSNSTDYIFNEIYISPTAANDWGEELLGSTRILKDNGSLEVEIPAYDYDNYDIRIVDEDDDEYAFTYVSLQNGSEVAIYFGDEGLAADVYDEAGNGVATVLGALNGGGDGGGDVPIDDGGQGDVVDQQPVATGTGADTNGAYSFTVYNESGYDIYSIHMGIVNASSDHDIDILPYVLAAGESADLTGEASQGDWGNTEWSLYITDTVGDTSTSYDSFNPWTVSYVDIYWDSDNGGYVCDFVY